MTDQLLFCIDLDGTLLNSSSYHPSKENLEAIQEARSLGHIVYINTGRSWGNVPPILRGYMHYFDGICCANGSYIRQGEKVLRNEIFPHSLVEELMQYLIEQEKTYALFEGENALLQTLESSPVFGSPGITVHDIPEWKLKYANAAFNVVSCEGQLSQAFLKKFGDRLNIFQCEIFADCTLPGCSKATALKYIADLYGIRTENTVAIGDSANDLPMMQAAGYAVAMQNSDQIVLNYADYIAPSNDNSGVADAILHRIHHI